MVRKLERDALESQLSGVQALIASTDPNDFIGRASLEYHQTQVREQISQLASKITNTGSVVLAFEGGPVVGSRGIDTQFAATTLNSYQDLISKQLAAMENGGLAQRGPVPSRSAGKLNITSLVHGSVGFQLEEEGSDEPEWVDSAVKQSIAIVDDMISAFSSGSDQSYLNALSQVDRRVLISLQKFYNTLYRDSASLKIIEDERDILINHNSVHLAISRINDVDVQDEELSVRGELLGLAPVQRRFDFRPFDGSPIISGQAGQLLSADYLERLHSETRLPGRTYVAKLIRRVATRVGGSFNESYTLVDLTDPLGPPTYIE
jgi:hypothetical protein